MNAWAHKITGALSALVVILVTIGLIPNGKVLATEDAIRHVAEALFALLAAVISAWNVYKGRDNPPSDPNGNDKPMSL